MLLDEITQQELRKKYNPDGSKLRNMQMDIKEILDVVDDICVKHNIPYWLSSGTLLGAVRHGGFIPWDDDVDIDMLRSDIPRFIKACQKDLPKEYAIQTHKTDSNYYLNLVKVRKQNTIIEERVVLKDKKEFKVDYKYQGLFIDIIPIEKSLLILCKLSVYPMALLNKAIYYWNLPKWIIELIYYMNQCIYALFRFLSHLIFWKKDYHATYGTWFFRKRRLVEIFPLNRIEFENSMYNSPADYDAYLKRIYTEYESLPSEILRKPMHVSNVDE